MDEVGSAVDEVEAKWRGSSRMTVEYRSSGKVARKGLPDIRDERVPRRESRGDGASSGAGTGRSPEVTRVNGLGGDPYDSYVTHTVANESPLSQSV